MAIIRGCDSDSLELQGIREYRYKAVKTSLLAGLPRPLSLQSKWNSSARAWLPSFYRPFHFSPNVGTSKINQLRKRTLIEKWNWLLNERQNSYNSVRDRKSFPRTLPLSSAADDEITTTTNNKNGDDKLRLHSKTNKLSLGRKYGASSSEKDLRSNNLTHNARKKSPWGCSQLPSYFRARNMTLKRDVTRSWSRIAKIRCFGYYSYMVMPPRCLYAHMHIFWGIQVLHNCLAFSLSNPVYLSVCLFSCVCINIRGNFR